MAARNKTTYPPLAEVNKPHLTTNEAAHYINRSAQTLRIWKCNGTGPIQPATIAGRLAWPTDKLKELLGVATTTAPATQPKPRATRLAVVAGAAA